jgi:hypothetical protein
MIREYEHTAMIAVIQIFGRERAEEIRSEPAAGVRRKYESSRGQNEFSPQPFLP